MNLNLIARRFFVSLSVLCGIGAISPHVGNPSTSTTALLALVAAICAGLAVKG